MTERTRPSSYPPPFAARDVRRRADRPRRRADRGRRPHRRRRPGRPRVRDPARPAARGAPRGGRAARRGARRGGREGQAAGLAPPLRRGRQPALAAAPVRRPLPARRAARRTGRCTASPSTCSRGARRCGIPPPPTMRNHGNVVFSLSRLGRWLAEQAEEGGAMILPETAAEKLLVSHGRVVGVRTGDKGRGRDGERAGQLRAGLRPRREGDGARRGDAGPPHRRRARPLRAARRRAAGVGARRQGGLEGREAARPRHPHDGLAAAHRREVPRVRRLVRLPDGRRHAHDRDGRRARLPRRRAVRARPAPGAEDAPEDPRPARGRRAGRVGREDDPERRLPRAAEAAARAGSAHVRRRRRHGQHPDAQGRALRDRVGPARGRGGVRGAAARQRRRRPRSRSYDDAVRVELHLERPARGARHAPGVRARLLRRRRARERDDGLEGPDRRREAARPSRTPSSRCCARTARRATRPRTATLTFDKLSSVFASGNKTRDDQPNHIRIERRVPREVARAVGAHVPGAGLRGRRRRRRRHGHACSSRRRTASSAARSRPRAAGSPRPRAARGPSTR